MSYLEKKIQKLPWYVFILPYIINAISVYIITSRTSTNKCSANSPHLYDIIASNTPDLNEYANLIDYSLLLYFLPFLLNLNKKYILSLIQYHSILTLLRVILYSSTILPPCKNENCDQYNSYQKYIFGFCNDKLFSGHISLILILMYLIYKNKLVNNTVFKLMAGLTIFMSVFIIMARWHYTIDVLLAYIITGSLICFCPNL